MNGCNALLGHFYSDLQSRYDMRRVEIEKSAPGRILLEIEPVTSGEVVKRGKLKLWTGEVPATPLAQAVEAARHTFYTPFTDTDDALA